jgi:hypothetical protein
MNTWVGHYMQFIKWRWLSHWPMNSYENLSASNHDAWQLSELLMKTRLFEWSQNQSTINRLFLIVYEYMSWTLYAIHKMKMVVPLTDEYRIMTVLKVETYILTSMPASPIMYVETFKTNVTVFFIGNIINCLTTWTFIVAPSVFSNF